LDAAYDTGMTPAGPSDLRVKFEDFLQEKSPAEIFLSEFQHPLFRFEKAEANEPISTR